mmetsp:Transcript_10890/g.23915  ORF Transcript_10890/g.23915 Transcript_10890/m.23915 type:complete len:393 (-) Transcript_10890:186-1364(-)
MIVVASGKQAANSFSSIGDPDVALVLLFNGDLGGRDAVSFLAFLAVLVAVGVDRACLARYETVLGVEIVLRVQLEAFFGVPPEAFLGVSLEVFLVVLLKRFLGVPLVAFFGVPFDFGVLTEVFLGALLERGLGIPTSSPLSGVLTREGRGEARDTLRPRAEEAVAFLAVVVIVSVEAEAVARGDPRLLLADPPEVVEDPRRGLVVVVGVEAAMGEEARALVLVLVLVTTVETSGTAGKMAKGSFPLPGEGRGGTDTSRRASKVEDTSVPTGERVWGEVLSAVATAVVPALALGVVVMAAAAAVEGTATGPVLDGGDVARRDTSKGLDEADRCFDPPNFKEEEEEVDDAVVVVRTFAFILAEGEGDVLLSCLFCCCDLRDVGFCCCFCCCCCC